MRSDYSITKGIGKGLFTMLMAGVTIATFAGFADFTLWQLLEQYVKPVLGSITVAGVLKLAANYIKFNYLA